MGRPPREKTEKTKQLSDRLKELVKEKNEEYQKKAGRTLTITEMASKMQMPQSCFSNFLNDMQTPGADSISKLATFFKVSADYLVGNSDIKSVNLEIQDICERTRLSEKSLNTLMEDPYAPILINALLESEEIESLSRSFRRLLVSIDNYYEDGKTYGFLDKPVAFPILEDEKDGEQILLRDKMEEQGLDAIKFVEYLCRDTFSRFTSSIVGQRSEKENGKESR